VRKPHYLENSGHIVVDKDIQNPNKWVVTVIKDLPTTQRLSALITKGFVCNGGNIPLWLQRSNGGWLDPVGDGLPAFIYHDWLIKEKEKGVRSTTRKKIDQAFRGILLKIGCPPLITGAMYLGVRAYAIYKGRK